MKPFFQHLKPVSPLPSLQERQGLAQVAELEDLQRYRGQSVPSEVIDPLTKRKLILFEQLPFAMADDLLPNTFTRHYPSSVLPTGVSASQRLAQVTRSLDRDDDPGEIEMHTGSDFYYDKILAQGFVVGADKTDVFQVSHLTGNRWHCNGGVVRGGGRTTNTQELPATILNGASGFIGFWAELRPEYDSDLGKTPYQITVQGFEIIESYEQLPPTRKLPPADTESDGVIQWSAGRMFVPVAYVRSSTVGPFTLVTIEAGTDIVFPESYDGPGLPVL